MPAEAARLLPAWWGWITEAVLLGGACLAVAACADRLLPRSWAAARAALWGAALGRALVLPDWGASAAVWLSPALVERPAVSARALPLELLFGIWSAGAVGLAAWVALRYAVDRRALRNEVEVRYPASFAAAVSAAAAELGMRAPRVVFLRDLSGPATFGFLRPVVLLPHDLFERCDREDVRHVLLHEFVHARRRDPLWSVGAWFVQALLWFDPLVWWGRARFEWARELSCDAEVTSRSSVASDGYTRTLAAFALASERGAHPAWAGFSGRSRIVRRLEFLERAPRPAGRSVRAVTVLAAAALFSASLPAARAQLTTAEALAEPGCLRLRYHVFAAMGDVPGPSAPTEPREF